MHDDSYVTSDLPGVGGRLRESEEDFLVEEQPLYQPSGSGEHVYLFVEKRGLTTSQLVHAIARHFGVPREAVGYSGMKDKVAITRQVISIHTPGRTFESFPEIRNDRLKVLWADMHTNKLRLGHLKGNRFSIRIRGVTMTGVLAAQRVLRALQERGVPNFAGEQRFGSRLNNHRLGRLLAQREWKGLLDEMLGPDPAFPHLNAEARALYARGEYSKSLDAFPVAMRHERAALHALEKGATPERAVRAVDVTQRRFWFTSLQSAVFNRCLSERLGAGLFDRCVAGDVAQKFENGACFRVGAVEAGDPALADRVRRFEISPSGPIWGAKMMRAEGAVDERERGALSAEGLAERDLIEAMRQLGESMGGARRPMRVPLIDPEIEAGLDDRGEYIRCAFELPPGSFATIVMREIMKVEPGSGEAE